MTPITAFTLVDMLSLLAYMIVGAVLVFALIFAIVASVGLIQGIINAVDKNRRQQARRAPTAAHMTENQKNRH